MYVCIILSQWLCRVSPEPTDLRFLSFLFPDMAPQPFSEQKKTLHFLVS